MLIQSHAFRFTYSLAVFGILLLDGYSHVNTTVASVVFFHDIRLQLISTMRMKEYRWIEFIWTWLARLCVCIEIQRHSEMPRNAFWKLFNFFFIFSFHFVVYYFDSWFASVFAWLISSLILHFDLVCSFTDLKHPFDISLLLFLHVCLLFIVILALNMNQCVVFVFISFISFVRIKLKINLDIPL